MNEPLLTEIEAHIKKLRELQDLNGEIIGFDNHMTAVKYARKIGECSEKLIKANTILA